MALYDVSDKISKTQVVRLLNALREKAGSAPLDYGDTGNLDVDEVIGVTLVLGGDGKVSLATGEVYDNTTVTCALTGTSLTTPTEAEMVTGGQTVIITLTGDEWLPSPLFNDTIRQAIVDGFSGEAIAHGWDVEIGPAIVLANVVRTSDTVVTITLPAAAAYVLAADETITFVCPASALVRATFPLGAETWDIVNA